jgi:hypothetical protein
MNVPAAPEGPPQKQERRGPVRTVIVGVIDEIDEVGESFRDEPRKA